MIVIPENILWLLIVSVSLLIMMLIVVLTLRFKRQVRSAVRDEIYAHFPAIRSKIEDYERQLDRLKLDLEDIRKKSQVRG